MRLKEIEQLIDWLRVPGREVAIGSLYSASQRSFCSLGKLYDICGAFDHRTFTAKAAAARDVDEGLGLDVYDRDGLCSRWSMIAQINDSKGPLAVADYLEAEFPQ